MTIVELTLTAALDHDNKKHKPPDSQTSIEAMDRESVYTLSVGFGQDGRDDEGDSKLKFQQQLIAFILEYRVDNQFIYRELIRENVLAKKYACDVNISHLITYNEELAHRLITEPADIIPIVSFTNLGRKYNLS